MPQATLFDRAIDNHGLFSDHFLNERLAEEETVRALHDEADAAFDKVRHALNRHTAELGSWNEAQTEDRFIQPVLEHLGWERHVQPHAQRQGRSGRPDYALFASDEQRRRAMAHPDGDTTRIFQHADAVADAKYWRRPLDGPAPDPAREDTASMRRENPSFQIIDYLTLTGVDWGILTNGAQWRLYYTDAPSRLETYFEVNLEYLCSLAETGDEAEARRLFRLFYALFRAQAFLKRPDGRRFIERVYEASDTYSEELEDTLKKRVFDHVFLELATGLYEHHLRQNGDADPDEVLDDVYRATLQLLYRLLFVLYAESRDLLPVRDEGYYSASLTRLAVRAQEQMASGRSLSARHTNFWNDLCALFETIDTGDPAFNVPAYNGGLFHSNNSAGAFLDRHAIGQKYLVRALVNLTAVDPENEPTGPGVDYKTLDVRQLGSIYEGLLEHRLVLTEDGALDLQTDKGERKATGSYYTPHYIVEYIVEHTLGPIVEERIEQFEGAMTKIEDLREKYSSESHGLKAKLAKYERQAVDAFFTVRVCDPAMGSGHFLVHAADYLAEKFGQILGRYPEHNPVIERLEAIRGEILSDLGRQGITLDDAERRLRDTSLLKRLVMKRCIYGVDLNPMAVELAKLSLWLHSFTVGAPLSFLDHHLKAGNSLIGTSVDTVIEAIQADLFGNIQHQILGGTKYLQDAAFNTDATISDVEESAAAFHAYQDKMEPYKRLLDLWTSQHFGNKMGRTLVRDYAREVIDAFKTGKGAVLQEQSDTLATAKQLRAEKRIFHWELEFPEVFYNLDPPGEKQNPGFDAVIGNPPYENAWSMTKTKSDDRKAIDGMFKSGGLLEGHWDMFVPFVAQALRLAKRGGQHSYILPNPFLLEKYASELRRHLLTSHTLGSILQFGEVNVFEQVERKTLI